MKVATIQRRIQDGKVKTKQLWLILSWAIQGCSSWSVCGCGKFLSKLLLRTVLQYLSKGIIIQTLDEVCAFYINLYVNAVDVVNSWNVALVHVNFWCPANRLLFRNCEIVDVTHDLSSNCDLIACDQICPKLEAKTVYMSSFPNSRVSNEIYIYML